MSIPFHLAVILSTLIAACLASVEIEGRVMGLDLTLTYGTAIFWTPNSTSNVAVIEGSPQYKLAMSNLVRYSSTDEEDVAFQRPWFCRYFPGLKRCTPDEDLVAVADMLRALRTACDDFAGVPVPYCGVSTPVPRYWDQRTNQSAFIYGALDFAELPKPGLRWHFAGEAAAMANGGNCTFGMSCKANRWIDYTPVKAVLTVDYSQKALTTSLMAADENDFDALYVETRFDLGAASLSSQDDPQEHWRGVKGSIERALAYTMRALTTYSKTPLQHEALHVVVYGDAVGTAGLRTALKESLEPYEPGFVVLPEDRKMADPIFAAAEGTVAFLDPFDGRIDSIDVIYFPQDFMKEEHQPKTEL
ncbi:hypothetical protein KC332_g10617 [Hortaea werneckii]|uniref:Uncharacterized protein n=2 Tax=Hortaea werneckii TaxID=91943 RepID=A0A3M7I7L7_HORWE|nr:hypothetical protein KC358_g11600 [Hortaea werneckii]OTA39356.1 hypothetical protein BTJ68_00710 [Hortaea werneckii EXF-2000]KAI6815493.1 hypothetical protein KC350_g11016 [Hortaea werneckii]KAI6915823.1 hypothetical protein KC348_g11838 [Hortaea werneckii]KAI6930173.1 hypothetical protein KC341_g10387 [Hortaea werneckii]